MTKQLGASVLADMLEAYGVTHVFFLPAVFISQGLSTTAVSRGRLLRSVALVCRLTSAA